MLTTDLIFLFLKSTKLFIFFLFAFHFASITVHLLCFTLHFLSFRISLCIHHCSSSLFCYVDLDATNHNLDATNHHCCCTTNHPVEARTTLSRRGICHAVEAVVPFAIEGFLSSSPQHRWRCSRRSMVHSLWQKFMLSLFQPVNLLFWG